MILFWALAALLTAAALAFLLPPLLRKRTAAPDARSAANAAVYREQLEELGAELQRGALTQEEYERASREVEHRIVAEHGAASAPEAALHRAPLATAIAVALLVPLAAALAYWQLGEPRALNAEAMRAPDPQEMEMLINRLANRLEKSPGDAEGWALLGRSLASLGQPAQAARAFARAVQLQPQDKELLVEFIKSLALAGRAEFEARNYAGAIEYWDRILPFAPPDSEFARTVSQSIAEAKALAGSPAVAAVALRGIVSLDPALKGKVSPADTVFILARPPSGSRMPLAVTRTTVGQLPYAFTLDDSMAMAPGATISSHPQVVIVARVSKAGSAAPRKGDIEGVSAPVKPGAADVQVRISTVID